MLETGCAGGVILRDTLLNTSENNVKPPLSKSEEIYPFALAVCLWVGDVKLWAGHHQRGTGTALL